MNNIENIKKNTVRDGVKTPDGTLYAVSNGEALEIYLHQEGKPFVKVVSVTHISSANQLGVVVYEDVYNEDSQPQIILLDKDGETAEDVVVLSYEVHTTEVKDGKIVNEYHEHFGTKEEAINSFVADVICEKRAFDYDRVIGIEIEETEESWLAYFKGKKETDYKYICVEEFPELIRVVK